MVNALKKEHFATYGRQIKQIDKAVNQTTSSSDSSLERVGFRECPSPWGMAQLQIQKEACGRETTRNILVKQRRKRNMD